MRRVIFATLVFAGLPVLSNAQAPRVECFNGLPDLSIYFKSRFSTPNAWDQQVGLRAKLLRYGNLSGELSIAYDPNYPIKFDIEPKWTSGVQVAYFFTNVPFPVAVYTTPKYNLVNGWKEEFGLNLRLVDKPRYYVNSSLDYQFPYPYVQTSKPTFQGSLTVGFPF